MSSRHDNERKLDLFQGQVKAVIAELVAEDKRWTMTAIAKAGGLSRNQLYAWIGKGPQRIKRLPDQQRVQAFYEGIGKSPRSLFVDLGWDATLLAEDSSPPAPEPLTDMELRINLLRLAIDRPGIKVEERRELEVQLARLLAAKQMNDDAMAAADAALRRHGAA